MPRGNKILIVDDDPELRDALTERLSLHEEFETVAVENGSKGVQAAKVGQIDLVIMDVGLPDIDGREAARLLRKNGFGAPIIMLTGYNTDSDTILGAGIRSERLRHQAIPLCCAAGAHSCATAPARSQRGRDLHNRAIYVPGQLKATAQSQRQQSPPDREGNVDLTLPLSRL